MFSLLSWNIENFALKSKQKSLARITEHIKNYNPDVMGIYEVKGKDIFKKMVHEFPDYHFHITEGPQSQNILVGVRGNLTAFISQREKFKSGQDTLRPGALLTLHINGENYSILFVHAKSMTDPRGFGLRDSQFSHSMSLKRALDDFAGKGRRAKFIIVGDLNTMGMDYPFRRSISSRYEIKRLEGLARRNRMRLLKKDYSKTYSNGKLSGDLDHVLATTNISVKKISGQSEVKVRGWRGLSINDKKEFIKNISDHNSLYFEVEG